MVCEIRIEGIVSFERDLYSKTAHDMPRREALRVSKDESNGRNNRHAMTFRQLY